MPCRFLFDEVEKEREPGARRCMQAKRHCSSVLGVGRGHNTGDIPQIIPKYGVDTIYSNVYLSIVNIHGLYTDTPPAVA